MTEITDDPFATVEAAASEEKPAAKKAAPAKAKKDEAAKVPAQGIDFAQFLAEMTIDEEDFAPPAPVVTRYIKPAEHSWIPVRITSAVVEQKERKAVVATAPDGTLITTPKAIDMAVEQGLPQSVEEGLSMWQFMVEAEHVLTCFGTRNKDYRIYTSVFPVRVPLRKPENRNGVEVLGFDSNSGRKLMSATRTVKPGERLTEQDAERLEEIAQEMVGKVVMARVRYRPVDSTIPRKNPDGSFVKAKIDEDSGSFIRLEKSDNGFTDTRTGEIVEIDNSAKLIPFGEQYLIPDNSDDGSMVKDVVQNVYDNLADEVAVVPGRIVTIQRQDETEVEAEVTWETAGFITTAPVRAGTLIQAETEGKELITASWLGTHWEEVDAHELTVGDDGKIRLVSAASLAQKAVGGSGLDVFKGDSPA